MRPLILPAGILGMLLYLFCYPAQALEASKSGLGLWLNTLLPTLLPFLILSNLLLEGGWIGRWLRPAAPIFRLLLGVSPYGAYVVLLGLLCGYPMGAKLTGDLYRAGKLSFGEASYLLTFSNNASPIFLTTYLALATLKRPDALPAILFILYASTALCALCFRFFYRPAKSASFAVSSCSFPRERTLPGEQKKAPIPRRKTAWIDTSIMNGFETITRLGGYILLFSIAAAAVNTFWPGSSPWKYLLLTMTEISTGLYQLSLSGLSQPAILLIALSGTSFGGLCILAQTGSVLTESRLSLTPYLAGKALNLFFTVLLTLLITQFV